MEKVISTNLVGNKLLKLNENDRKVLLKEYFNSNDVDNINNSFSNMIDKLYKNIKTVNILSSFDTYNVDISKVLNLSKHIIPIIENKKNLGNGKEILLTTITLCAIINKNKLMLVNKIGEVYVTGYIIPNVTRKNYNLIAEELSQIPDLSLININYKQNYTSGKYLIINSSDNIIPLEYIKFYIGKNIYNTKTGKVLEEIGKKNIKEIYYKKTKDIIYGDYKDLPVKLINKNKNINIILKQITIDEDLEFKDDSFSEGTRVHIDVDLYRNYMIFIESGIFLHPDKLNDTNYLQLINNLYNNSMEEFYINITNVELINNIIKPLIQIISIIIFFIDSYLNKNIITIDVKNILVESYSNKTTPNILEYYIKFMIYLFKSIFNEIYKKTINTLDIDLFNYIKNTYNLFINEGNAKILKKIDFLKGIITIPFNDKCFFLGYEMENFRYEPMNMFSFKIKPKNYLFYIPKIKFTRILKKNKSKKITTYTDIEKEANDKDNIKYTTNITKLILEINIIFKKNNLIKSQNGFEKKVNEIGFVKNILSDNSVGLDNEGIKKLTNDIKNYNNIFYKFSYDELILLYGKHSTNINTNSYMYLFYYEILENIKKGKIKKMFDFISEKILETSFDDISESGLAIKRFRDEQMKEERNALFYGMSVDEKELSGFNSMTKEQQEEYINEKIDYNSGGTIFQDPLDF